jgi:hypothetical protein
MNAPQHNMIQKRQDWSEQTTVKSFINGVGTPDGDDVALMLDMLGDHWERIIEKFPHYAQDLAHEALAAIQLAFKAVDSALEESECDPVSDAEDFRSVDNSVRG